MSLPRTVADVLREHVILEVEGIDRMYLNVYQPKLQYVPGVVGFFRCHRGEPVASSTLMDPMSKAFIAATKKLVADLQIPLHEFSKHERKDDVAAKYRARYPASEGVVFVGKAQEKTKVFRTERRVSAAGKKYPWIVESTGVVNHFYFYCEDADFGPFFLKFCTFFPYNAKLCINGHEYAKKQLTKEGIAFEALDNGVRTETTINNTRDFGIGKRLVNLPALREIGFQANRRLLHVQQVSQNCALGETAFEQLNRPTQVQGQRVSALRYADDVVHTLLSALLVFRLLPRGFSNRDLRQHWAPLLGRTPTPGQMTYQLRRLRLRGLIERQPCTHRYGVTEQGFRTALFYTRTQQRLFRPAFTELRNPSTPPHRPLAQAFARVGNAIDRWLQQQKVPA